jgi:hypothetical protein
MIYSIVVFLNFCVCKLLVFFVTLPAHLQTCIICLSSMSQVSGAQLHGSSGLATNYDISVSRSAAAASGSASESKASLLALDDLSVGAGTKQPAQTAVSAGSYQNSGSAAKDFVNAKVQLHEQYFHWLTFMLMISEFLENSRFYSNCT